MPLKWGKGRGNPWEEGPVSKIVDVVEFVPQLSYSQITMQVGFATWTKFKWSSVYDVTELAKIQV